MGFTSYIERMKNWAVSRVYRVPLTSDESDSSKKRFPNLGENIQHVVQTPQFEQVLNTASPYLLASMGAWPGYWIYRGFDYHSHRAHIPLPIYIRQTFYQAKLLQLIIIMTGILTIVKNQKNLHVFPGMGNRNDS
ncbi:uncharacterized protein LOC111596971 [Drosophila hydei]|uniref:Uncharacterized protein LOC111596971 n=1 Tax=Drosophila hydei TaxID=7224 RepID=A0A6J1LKX4_DROHY|nr:uncharacterized protein LOC111596971 [Drosophila hydei]